ncbi:hypothetical protein INR49_024246 [Caranx melampygus]|nr:hypothetical protein INR49_024246 [Caranx melampygus]
MSIEYTIDIQLTELGFPDILQAQDTSVTQTSSHPPASRSGKRKHRLLSANGKEANAGKQPSVCSTAPRSETSECKGRPPAHSLQDEQAAKGAVLSDPSTGPGTQSGPQSTTHGKEGCDGDTLLQNSADMQQDEEDDSDVSEDSDVYDEEEEEEEDDYEEEEGKSNGSNHPGNYHCSVCNLQLPSKFKLQDHMNLHTGARPYRCAECGKRFCQIYNYRVHLRTHVQTKVDRLKCRICLTGFASQDDLTDHLSKTHFEDKFYECDLCKRVFTSLKACEYHVSLHKCMLDVVCEICGRKFSSPKSLARHRRKLCRSSFKCTDCMQTFTRKNALLRHSFSHLGLLPYTCVRCHCHFRLAKLYRQHKCEPERIHCVACLREFASQAEFQQHKKDTGCWGSQSSKGNEIRCLECGEQFDSTEELKKHAGAHQRNIPKKRQTTKSSSSGTKTLNVRPASSCPARTVSKPVAVLNNPAAPVEDPVSADLGTEGVSTGSGPSDGLWKLTLDKQPPPGVKLVFFLPVCPTQSNNLSVSSETPQTLPVPSMEVKPPFSGNGHHGFGVPHDTPLDLVTKIKQDPEYEAPLDLSKKCNSAKSLAGACTVKNEPEEFEISEGTNREGFNSSDSQGTSETNPGGEATEMMQVEMGPINLSTLNTTSELIMNVKKEPQSSSSESDLWSSRS